MYTATARPAQYKVWSNNYDSVISTIYRQMLQQPIYIQISTQPFATHSDITDTTQFEQDAIDCIQTKKRSKNRSQDIAKTAQKNPTIGHFLSTKTALVG